MRCRGGILVGLLGLVLGVGCAPTEELPLSATTKAVSVENGLTSNALSFNALGLNGVNLNGVNLNGVNLNGVNLNGVNLNGLTQNALTVNGVNLNGLYVDALESTEMIGDRTVGEMTKEVFSYIYSCAMPQGSTMELVVDGESYGHYVGGLGLAPEWGADDGVCDVTCQRWISACLLARTNFWGTPVEISIRGEHPALATSAEERALFTLREGTFFGNLFADYSAAYACSGPGSDMPDLTARFCASYDDQCDIIQPLGDCLIDPELQSNSPCDGLDDEGAVTGCWYPEAITVYLALPDPVCGNTVCEVGEAAAGCSDCTQADVTQLGTAHGQDVVVDERIDPDGYRVIGGVSQGNLDLTGIERSRGLAPWSRLTSLAGYGFVSKLGADGEPIWTRRYADRADLWAFLLLAIDIDAQGNIYAAGSYSGELSKTDPSSHGGIWISEIGTNGAQHWFNAHGIDGFSNTISVFRGMRVTPDGRPVVATSTWKGSRVVRYGPGGANEELAIELAGDIAAFELTPDGGLVIVESEKEQVTVRSYGAAGAVRWERLLARSSDAAPILHPNRANYAELDRDGNLYLYVYDPSADQGWTAAAHLERLGTLHKLAPDGGAIWAHAMPYLVGDLAVASDGGVVGIGACLGETHFGTTDQRCGRVVDGAMTKQDAADGTTRWAHVFRGPVWDLGTGVEVYPDGRLSVVGAFNGTVFVMGHYVTNKSGAWMSGGMIKGPPPFDSFVADFDDPTAAQP